MNTRHSPTPPGAGSARQNPSASPLPSQQPPGTGSQQQTTTMPPSSKHPRGATPSTSRSSLKPSDSLDKPTRPSSKDGLKQKVPRKPEEIPKPTKAEEVSICFHTMCTIEQRNGRLIPIVAAQSPEGRFRWPAYSHHLQNMLSLALRALHNIMRSHLLL